MGILLTILKFRNKITKKTPRNGSGIWHLWEFKKKNDIIVDVKYSSEL